MRFQVNMDCTPEEARQFIGLPDLVPMQKELMDMVSRRLSENIQSMEPEALMKTWVPALFQGWSDIQSQFWKQMTSMGGKNGGMGNMGAMGEGMNPMNPMNFTMSSSPFAAKPATDDADKSRSKKK